MIMRWPAWLLMGLCGCVLSSAGEAGPARPTSNQFEVHWVDTGRCTINWVWPQPQSDVPNVRRIDRDEYQSPAFVHVVEIQHGRSVVIDDVVATFEPVPERGPAEDWLVREEDLLDVSLARMGERVFLRMEIRPYQYHAGESRWTSVQTLSAVLSVSESDPSPPVLMDRADVVVQDEFPCIDCPPQMSVGVSPGMGGTAPEFVARRSVSTAVAWKMAIQTAGLYRVTGADLAAAGVPEASRDTTLLRVSVRDRTLPVWRSTDGPMQAQDWIQFYAAAIDSTETRENIYWLSIDASSPDVPTLHATPDPMLADVHAFRQLVRYEPRKLYSASYRPLDDSFDHWFAMFVFGNTTSNIPFATPHPTGHGDAFVWYSLHGSGSWVGADPDHRSEIRIGGALAVTRDYNGEVSVSGVGAVPASHLNQGDTMVSVQQVLLPDIPSGAAGLVSAYVESLHLCYERWLRVTGYPFFASSTQTGNMVLSNVAANIMLVDVSDPFEPVELISFEQAGDTLRFFAAIEGRCFALFNTDVEPSAPVLERVHFRNLSDPSRLADYLVVTPTEFRRPVFELLRHRYKNELSVQVATPHDVYNEFAYGVRAAVAVRQYFGFAYHHYAEPPEYALLVGVGSYDPLNDRGHDRPEHIPVRIGAAPFRRTAHEQWFVTVDGPDLLPDIKLGRFPFVTANAVSNAVRKMIAFETAATNAWWRESALLVADQVDGSLNFKAHVQNSTRQLLMYGGFDEVFGIQTVYRDDVNQATATQTINTEIDWGVHFVHYMGHGSVAQWSNPAIWNIAHAVDRPNSIYPVFAVFSCQIGAFHEPEGNNLASAILGGPGAGSAVFAPSALSIQQRAEKLADGFYQALAVERVPRLGDAAQEAFLNLWANLNENASELRFYTIFGDPALHLWGGAEP